MTTETRVGIVTGLMIVVAASVYFFYGSDPGDDSILVSTPTRVTLPPKIPPAADQVPKRADNKPSAPQRLARSSRPTPAATSTETLALGRPPMRGAPTTPSITKPIAQTPPTLREPSSPVVLRTAPSTELVEATRDNLRADAIPNSDDPPVKQPAAISPTPPQPAPRGAPTVATRPPQVQDISPTPVTEFATAPKRPSLREMPESMWSRKKHTVVEGDTLSDISKQYFGDSLRADDILAANPQIKSARYLKIGDVLTLPDLKDAPVRTASSAAVRTAATDANPRVTSYATLVPPPNTASTTPPTSRTYTVQSGDTLYSIARKQYGSSKRWEEIFRLNRAAMNNNPARLARGMVLKLPE